MKIHVLPGDALTEKFNETNLDGELVICRECLVEGDVSGENLNDFWQTRAAFIEKTYGEPREKYFENVRGEFEKLLDPAATEINLWFENELFCQTNLWFCLYLLRDSAAKIYRVAPFVRDESEIGKGFGAFEAEDLEKCYASRIEFDEKEISLGARLWEAYRNADHETLEELSVIESPCFPYLTQICRAAIEKRERPKAVLREIIEQGTTDFAEIFREFSLTEGVYGFGDLQVKRILSDELKFTPQTFPA